MDEHKLSVSILAIIGVLTLVSFVILYTNSTGLYVYEQPASHKPVIVQTSTYRTPFNLCQQFLCNSPGEIGEAVPASPVGIETLTGNMVCRCPNGHEFIIRPDRIEEATYE